MTNETLPELNRDITYARAIPMVGRKDVVREIHTAIRDRAHDYLLYITAQGGIGKTILLRYTLANPPQSPDLLVAKDLVDLYHTRHHTPEGLVASLFRQLEHGGGFENYRRACEKLDALYLDPPADIKIIEGQVAETLEAFISDLNALEKRAVIALDTAEKLFFQRDPAARDLGLQDERPPVVDWLTRQFLPRIKNVVVLLAGRPRPMNETTIIDKVFRRIELQNLKPDEVDEYFTRYAQEIEKDHPPTATYIRSLSPDQRRVMYVYLSDYDEDGAELGVRPILLALLIYYRLAAGDILLKIPEFGGTLEQAQNASIAERREVQDRFKSEVVQSLVIEESEQINEVIRLLGPLTKGLNAEILSQILDLEPADAISLLERLQPLSIVKVRPEDQRVFLHDEAYDLLRQYHWEIKGAPHFVLKEFIFPYYDRQIKYIQNQIEARYQESKRSDLPPTEETTQLFGRLQDALVEDLHYHLHTDLEAGFVRYFLYAENVLTVDDPNLDQQLRAELLGVLSDEREYAKSVGNEDLAAEVERIWHKYVIPDAALRWVKRMRFHGEYQNALDLIGRLRTDCRFLLESGDDLVWLELDSLEGLVLTAVDRFEEAQAILNDTLIEKIRAVQVPNAQGERCGAIMARALNNLAYLARNLWQLKKAERVYREALPYWRAVKMEVEHANTLNNLSFVQGWLGEFEAARRNGRDALRFRERFGPKTPVILSLTTLAANESKAGHYREAQTYAQTGLDLAKNLEYDRGIGLAHLVLAEILRFSAEPEQPGDFNSRMDLLNTSLKHAEDAARIFASERGKSNLISALIEEGKTRREICRLTKNAQSSDGCLVEERLKQAEEMARQAGNWTYYLDAALSRMWHYHYADQDEEFASTLKDLQSEIAVQFKGYVISDQQMPQHTEESITLVFGHLARLHILLGVRALSRHEKPTDKDLEEAAREFALTFEYDRLIAPDFREIRRAINNVHKLIKKLNAAEIFTMYQALNQTSGLVFPPEVHPTDLYFWKLLESNFGTYEVFERLIG